LDISLFFCLYRFELRKTDGPIDRFAKGGRICSNGITEQCSMTKDKVINKESPWSLIG
jgi:hypothetical protein